ncbi:MAG: gliding motility-associated C-terminal domain-containing protein [Bacteroidetes bacterium]|nr:gliding motility-associated C-terminal domain-containing protein [Bacteroidota bacterium]
MNIFKNYLLPLLFISTSVSFAQRAIDGNKIINTVNTIVNEYTTLTANATAGATTITVASSDLNANNRFGVTSAGNSLNAGDLIMIIQMQGPSSTTTSSIEFPAGSGQFYGFPNDSTWGQTTSYNNCGHYEFCEVSAVPSLTTITVDCGLKYDYTSAGRVQVIRVPRYKTLTITSPGVLTCPAWAAGGIFTGGIVAVEVYGNSTIGAGASINASALGFRGGSKIGDNASGLGGGQVARSSNTEGAEKGEGIFGYQADYDIMAGRYCRGVAGNGGGGGDMHNAGGGGGSNAGNLIGWDGKGNPVAGYNLSWNIEGFGMSAAHTSPGGGRGGYSFSSQNRDATVEGPKPFQSGAATNNWLGDYRENNGGWGGRPLDYTTGRLFIGGGGGAGDQDNGCAGNGGIGGGIVYFMSYGTISGTGTIVANGGAGANTNTSGASVGIDGAGGGGGGGTIILNSVGTISGISASANGGAGGNQNVTGNEAEGPGGGGGGGYIALSTGAIVSTVNGGANGVTNSTALTEFPPNGATMGAAGLTNQLITNDTIFAANVTICSGNTASLTATMFGTVPVGTTISWYTTQTGGAPVGSGSPFVTPTLAVTTTYYVGFCPGTYRIPVIVTVNTSPTASNAGVNQSLCATSATLAGNTPLAGTGTWTLISGTGVITTPSSPTSTVTGLGLGANIFQWTISNPPCGTSSTQVTITSTGGPTTSVAGLPQTVCGTTATLAGNTATTGTGLWTLLSGAGTITTPTSPTSGVTGLGVGPNVFQWAITSAPCPASTSSVTITGVAAPTVSNAGPVQTICGTTATLAGNTAITGTGTWTLVSGTGTITTPSSPTSGITGLGVGPNVFQWTISNAPCVASSSTVTINGVAAPTVANAGPIQTVCGTTATLAGNTATTGTGIWTLVSGTGTITTPSSPSSGVTGLGVGPNVFQWTISNAPCVASTSTVTITGVAAPTVSNAGPVQTVCGTTATLAGNTATTGTGLWTLVSGAGTITTPTSPTSGITGLGIGPNLFQWTISNAPCVASFSTVTITGVAAPTVSIAGPAQSVCATSATLAGNIATTGTGTWTLVSGTGTITTPSSPTSGLTGLGLGANVFQWTIDNPPCTPSTSTVTITSTGGATTSNAGPDQSVCGTSATLAGNTPTIGTGLWTLVSGTGIITSPSSPASGVTGLGVGANVFQWSITSLPCPPSISIVTITNTGGVTTSLAGSSQTVCGTIATLAGNTPIVGTGTWTLVSGTGTISTPSSPISGITGLGVGANVFQWTITSVSCPPSSSTVTITSVVAPTTSVAGPNQTICSTSALLAANAPTIGTGTWTLVSGSGTITTPSSPTSTVTGLGIGANVFQWTIDNPPCIPSFTTVSITNTGGPSINTTSQTNVFCNGGSNASATVAGSGGAGSYTYSWTGGAGTSASVSGLSAGTYTVTVTDGAGCSSTTFVNITEPPAISGSVNTTSANCGSNDGSAIATIAGGSGTLTYSWAPGGSTTSSITSIGAGFYTVTVTDSLGCTFITSGTVSTIGGPTVNAGADVTITSGSSIVLSGTASIGATYSWTPPTALSCDTCASPIASPTQTTTYILTVTLGGCSSSDTITVFVEEDCSELFVPNVFSPNGDGANDSLKIYGGCIENLEFVIFDRWGEKVFETTDPAIAWDGTLHGRRLDAAIFVYYLNATIKGIEVKKHGNITLVK